MRNQRIYRPNKSFRRLTLLVFALAAAAFIFYLFLWEHASHIRPAFINVTTLAVNDVNLREPFGIGVKDGETYVSDGDTGNILRLAKDGVVSIFASNLDTPSAIAFDKNGDLIVADPGSHTIKRVDRFGTVSIVAGTENEQGDIDGNVLSSKFNAPVGVAVMGDGAIIVADTYNDKIKLIQDGIVTTIAGSTRGFADGPAAKFDTPCGVALWKDGRILVADTENRRIRVVESDGSVWTLAGNGEFDLRDGLLSTASFVRPMAVTVADFGEIYVADGESVRAISDRNFPFVETLSGKRRGFKDGEPFRSAFNRISGLAVDEDDNLIVADSDNGAVRKFCRTIAKVESKKGGEPAPIKTAIKTDPAEFRSRQPGRWPYDPPLTKRDIAGTLGEIRGQMVDDQSQVWFHNGLDIAGAYGETARFIRSEKVLRPVAAENFGTLRELIRMPELGYIHIRLGRDSSNKPFGDRRFQFSALIDSVRVPRGSKFMAGEAIGTLNPMNHVHLITGPSGDEMNALDAVSLPGIVDTILPVIENITLFDENWSEIETELAGQRIKLSGNTRIVIRAYDRMDGNPERRRLGVFRLGYQILRPDHTPLNDTNWNINFDRNPDPEAVRFAYAKGSRSGATGETIFNYIVTNTVNGNSFSEGFLDTRTLGNGNYILRVLVVDFFGNTASKDISIEVTQ